MKRTLAWLMISASLLGLWGCGGNQTPSQTQPPAPDRQLHLCIWDTYDFGAMGLAVKETQGSVLSASGNVITAGTTGKQEVTVADAEGNELRYLVTVYADARELGGRFPMDKGMFKGKKVIVFGDSITDGYLGEYTQNYQDGYFPLLCRYLETASDPTDLLNSNFACGGTTLAYGKNPEYGITGVQRLARTTPFYDTGRKRDPYSNILQADLCILYYGSNDLWAGVYAESTGLDGVNDAPTTPEEAVTIRGALYYAINRLHTLNPDMKILVLPPVIRAEDGNVLTYNEDKTDVINRFTWASFSQYKLVMEEVCRENGAMYVDWSPVFDYESFCMPGSAYTSDGLHPNTLGHRKMYDFLADYFSWESE